MISIDVKRWVGQYVPNPLQQKTDWKKITSMTSAINQSDQATMKLDLSTGRARGEALVDLIDLKLDQATFLSYAHKVLAEM